MALAIGFLLVALLGVAHHWGILAIRHGIPESERRRHLSIIGAFIGLLALHLLEILGFALAFRLLLAWGGLGDLGGDYGESWEGLIYFSGINFTTLGYTQIETSGPLRIVNMMLSLGGFMVLTWSATFLYSVWAKAWQR